MNDVLRQVVVMSLTKLDDFTRIAWKFSVGICLVLFQLIKHRTGVSFLLFSGIMNGMFLRNQAQKSGKPREILLDTEF